jgi:quercetin 2,3-dioxygenase
METTSLRVIPTSDLLSEDRGWTRGHAHAAFDDVPRHLPAFLDFAPMRLAVYQTVDPGAGYPLHDHQGIETLMLLLEGTCLHADSTGHRARIPANSVTVLSAGRGIEHSEFADDSGPVRAVMFWVSDGELEGAPRFATRLAPRLERTNRFQILAGDDGLPIRQRARMFGAYVEAGQSVAFELAPGRRAYLLATDATIVVNGVTAQQGDRLLASGSGTLAISAAGATEVVLLEV